MSERITSLFRLKIFLLVTLQNEGWSTGVVHGPGPWTSSTRVVCRRGVHVLYTSGIYLQNGLDYKLYPERNFSDPEIIN